MLDFIGIHILGIQLNKSQYYAELSQLDKTSSFSAYTPTIANFVTPQLENFSIVKQKPFNREEF